MGSRRSGRPTAGWAATRPRRRPIRLSPRPSGGGERSLNIHDNKEARRFQPRKLVDEGGQDSVGGPLPSHPTLQKWHSVEFGLTDEEIHALEMEDMAPATLTYIGWYNWMRSEEQTSELQ